MKRIIAIVLSVLLVLSCGIITVFAQTNDTAQESQDMYREKFKEKYIRYSWQNSWTYNELYHHYDESGSVDWVLVQAHYGLNTDNGDRILVRGHRVVLVCPYISGTEQIPFVNGYAVYDVKQDEFIDITNPNVSAYDGFGDAYDQYGIGRFIGDVDGDYEISVTDATIIQRCDAVLCDYPEDDEIESHLHSPYIIEQKYYSDFNRDGERNILDATCIQRYLIGMSYPIG